MDEAAKRAEEAESRLEELEVQAKGDTLIFKGLVESTYSGAASGARGAARVTTRLSSSRTGNVQSTAPTNATASNTTSTVTEDTDSHLSVENDVIKFCRNELHVNIDHSDISSAYRAKAGPKDNVRPVIVRFATRRAREMIYRAKKCLKHSQITPKVYISEQLTKSASALFYEARLRLKDKRVLSAWTQNGHVLVKFTTSVTEKPTVIKKVTDFK